jgi:hypothetical protein
MRSAWKAVAPDLVILDDRTRLDQGVGDITTVIDAHLGRELVRVIRDDPGEIELRVERHELESIHSKSARELTRVIGLRVAGS